MISEEIFEDQEAWIKEICGDPDYSSVGGRFGGNESLSLAFSFLDPSFMEF